MKRTFDGDPWHGPSVQAALSGVMATQASLRPIPEAHTIWELVKHMETWVQMVTQRLRGEAALEVPDEQDWPAAGDRAEKDWQESIRSLEKSVQELQKAVEEDQWELEDEVPGCDYTFEVMLNGVIHHNLYHAGQIVILKKAFVR